MDEGLLVLLAIAGVILFFLGPIGFFLTIGARERLLTAERKIQALEGQLRVAQGPLSAASAVSAAPANRRDQA